MHILILAEGDLGADFLEELKLNRFPERSASIEKLSGNFSINRRIIDRILLFDRRVGSSFGVCVCFDRENRHSPTINRELIAREILQKKIKASIAYICFDRTIESLLLSDGVGIDRFLGLKAKEKFSEANLDFRQLNHQYFSELFNRAGLFYKRGQRVPGLLECLDVGVIYNKCEELQSLVGSCKRFC